jgi:hypothetical protein
VALHCLPAGKSKAELTTRIQQSGHVLVNLPTRLNAPQQETVVVTWDIDQLSTLPDSSHPIHKANPQWLDNLDQAPTQFSFVFTGVSFFLYNAAARSN